MKTKISYQRSQVIGRGFREMIQDCIKTHSGQRICEIGAGANPLLDMDYVQTHHLRYSILDISEGELNKAPEAYQKIQADIASPEFTAETTFDFVFSRMLAEHVRDAAQFHRNIFSLLSPGGLAVHFFPTLYTAPFLLNRMIPENLGQALLNFFAPRDNYQNAKFPAYYHWCRGPLTSQIQKFESLGYEVVEYRGYFGHPRYYEKLKLIQYLHNQKTQYLLSHPHPRWTSYACVILKKSA